MFTISVGSNVDMFVNMFAVVFTVVFVNSWSQLESMTIPCKTVLKFSIKYVYSFPHVVLFV